MSNNRTERREWSKPQMTRLGEIKDVAGSTQTPNTQTTQGKT